jgi:hypothetical protein
LLAERKKPRHLLNDETKWPQRARASLLAKRVTSSPTRTSSKAAKTVRSSRGGRENGGVVGVVVGKLNAVKVAEVIGDIPQNVNFAVSLGTLQSFLNANNILYALDDSTATKTPADITDEATRYTVLLECLR